MAGHENILGIEGGGTKTTSALLNSGMTVQQVIDLILDQVPVKLGPATVDTLKNGDPSTPVCGIVVTFMATRTVLKKAVELGANLIITHEPTYYLHNDKPDWLTTDSVASSKHKWINEHGLAVFRFHDGPHRFEYDGIDAGMIKALGWTPDPVRKKVFTSPAKNVRDLARLSKERLGIPQVRVAGDLDAPCGRIGFCAGACGGQAQIELFRDHDVDVVVCGESPEWETCEYVRDAVEMGKKKALIVLGHANSEEAGMEWIAGWLKNILPAPIPLHYVAAGDPFKFV